MKANNKKLLEEVTLLKSQNQKTQELLKASSEAIEELKNFNSEIAKNNAKAQHKEILEGIKAAKQAGDIDTEVALTDQLADSKAALKTAETKPVVKETPSNVPPPLSTEVKEWLADNEWFGTDKRKTGFAYGVAEELKAAGKLNPNTREFYDALAVEVNKAFPNERRQVQKVDNSNGSAGGSAVGKTFADLPAEAKAACEKSGIKLVGEGRAFKNQEEWRKAYTTKYFEEA